MPPNSDAVKRKAGPAIALVITILVAHVACNVESFRSSRVCCGVPEGRAIYLNVRGVYNTPHQVHGAGKLRFYLAGTNSQDNQFPAFVAYPPGIDPTGLQGLNSLAQLSLVAGGIGLNGRRSLLYVEISCTPGNCTKNVDRYRDWIADVNPKPALNVLQLSAGDNPTLQSLNTFQVATTAIAFNNTAYDPERNCYVEYRGVNVSGIPGNDFSSHAIVNGDHVHTSVLVSTTRGLSTTLASQAAGAWQNVKTVLSAAGATLNDVLMVYVYLRNTSDAGAFDTVYPSLIGQATGGWKPPRSVISPNAFPLVPDAVVGFRVIARNPPSPRCPDIRIGTYNVPEILRDAPEWTSSASTIGDWIYVGDTYATRYGEGVESVPSDSRAAAQRGVDAMEFIAVEGGADRKDQVFYEQHSSQPLGTYLESSFGLADAYKWTRAAPPAYNLMSATPLRDQVFSWHGVYLKNDRNAEVDPSPFPWEKFSSFFPPGAVPDVPYCTHTTLSTCPQPGWFFDSASTNATLGQALGGQGLGPVSVAR